MSCSRVSMPPALFYCHPPSEFWIYYVVYTMTIWSKYGTSGTYSHSPTSIHNSYKAINHSYTANRTEPQPGARSARSAPRGGNEDSAHCDNFDYLRQTTAFTAIKLKKDAYVTNLAHSGLLYWRTGGLRPLGVELDLITELSATSSSVL